MISAERVNGSDSVARELVLEAAADKLGIEVTDDDIEKLIREQAEEAGDDPAQAVEDVFSRGAHETLREELRLRDALDRIVAEVKRIPAELAAAREKLWCRAVSTKALSCREEIFMAIGSE